MLTGFERTIGAVHRDSRSRRELRAMSGRTAPLSPVSPAVCLGIARHAIEEFRELALRKRGPFGPRLSEQVQAHIGLARAEALVKSAQCYWYENVERLWKSVAGRSAVSLEDRAGVRLAALTAAVDLLYRLAGSTPIFESSSLGRCWRDVHAAAQHIQVQEGRWETAGRVLFGLDPATPII